MDEEEPLLNMLNPDAPHPMIPLGTAAIASTVDALSDEQWTDVCIESERGRALLMRERLIAAGVGVAIGALVGVLVGRAMRRRR